jgi:hypothetical protein
VSALALVGLTLASRRRRLLGLLAFASLFLVAGLAARVLLSDEHGHVDVDLIFTVGGDTLASTLLLLGWLLGRFPMIAALALLAGFFSQDREAGYARLYAVRPVSLFGVYALRFTALAGTAFLLSAILMPLFDLLLLGTWGGGATIVLIAAQVAVYGGLMALLSVWTRGDVWIAIFLAVAAIVWNAAISANLWVIPAGGRELLTFLLPPQAALLELEGAFPGYAPIPWDAFLHAFGYGAVLLGLAALSLQHREI